VVKELARLVRAMKETRVRAMSGAASPVTLGSASRAMRETGSRVTRVRAMIGSGSRVMTRPASRAMRETRVWEMIGPVLRVMRETGARAMMGSQVPTS
jgi:hypothetical protein